jgi:hypothetical protein
MCVCLRTFETLRFQAAQQKVAQVSRLKHGKFLYVSAGLISPKGQVCISSILCARTVALALSPGIEKLAEASM